MAQDYCYTIKDNKNIFFYTDGALRALISNGAVPTSTTEMGFGWAKLQTTSNDSTPPLLFMATPLLHLPLPGGKLRYTHGFTLLPNRQHSGDIYRFTKRTTVSPYDRCTYF